MKRFLASVAAVILTVSGCASQHVPNEDEPGWNCHTQGNHICGPVTTAAITLTGVDCDYTESDDYDGDDDSFDCDN